MKAKSKRQGAKPLKKATERHHCYERAQRNLRLATVAALAQGMYFQTCRTNIATEPVETNQLEEIRKWSDRCLDDIELGVNALKRASTLVRTIDAQIRTYTESPSTFSHYTAVWLMNSYLCEEICHTMKLSHNWHYLTQAVTDWTEMMLEHTDEDYEEVAGNLAEKAREIIIGGLNV